MMTHQQRSPIGWFGSVLSGGMIFALPFVAAVLVAGLVGLPADGAAPAWYMALLLAFTALAAYQRGAQLTTRSGDPALPSIVVAVLMAVALSIAGYALVLPVVATAPSITLQALVAFLSAYLAARHSGRAQGV